MLRHSKLFIIMTTLKHASSSLIHFNKYKQNISTKSNSMIQSSHLEDLHLYHLHRIMPFVDSGTLIGQKQKYNVASIHFIICLYNVLIFLCIMCIHTATPFIFQKREALIKNDTKYYHL